MFVYHITVYIWYCNNKFVRYWDQYINIYNLMSMLKRRDCTICTVDCFLFQSYSCKQKILNTIYQTHAQGWNIHHLVTDVVYSDLKNKVVPCDWTSTHCCWMCMLFFVTAKVAEKRQKSTWSNLNAFDGLKTGVLKLNFHQLVVSTRLKDISQIESLIISTIRGEH